MADNLNYDEINKTVAEKKSEAERLGLWPALKYLIVDYGCIHHWPTWLEKRPDFDDTEGVRSIVRVTSAHAAELPMEGALIVRDGVQLYIALGKWYGSGFPDDDTRYGEAHFGTPDVKLIFEVAKKIDKYGESEIRMVSLKRFIDTEWIPHLLSLRDDVKALREFTSRRFHEKQTRKRMQELAENFGILPPKPGGTT
jgi:hypothetical protein